MVYFKDCKELSFLDLGSTGVSDAGLIHFKDCKALTVLHLYWTNVGDAGLVHFQDCKDLTDLNLAGTKVSDVGLAHFKGMPLKELAIDGTGITDLTPLQGMPLEDIRLTPKNITRGLEILRDMKSLKTIGISWPQAWPAAEFWERYDKGEFGVARGGRHRATRADQETAEGSVRSRRRRNARTAASSARSPCGAAPFRRSCLGQRAVEIRLNHGGMNVALAADGDGVAEAAGRGLDGGDDVVLRASPHRTPGSLCRTSAARTVPAQVRKSLAVNSSPATSRR